MADNVTLNVMTGGSVVAADDISSVLYQRIKLIHGADGINDGDVSTSNGLPVALLASTAAIGKLVANSGVDIGDVDITSIAAGDNNIGNVDIVSVPTDPFGATADAAVTAGATGSISAKLRSISRDLVANIVLAAGTNAIGKLAANSGIDIGDVDVTSIAAGDNNIGNVDIVTVPADPFGANADAAVSAGATGSISAKLRSISRDLVANIVLAAGTNAIGKLAANSGVDIGDVDITSIAAGDNNIGNVDLASAIPAGTNTIGKLLPPDVDVTAHTNYAKKYYTNAGAVTDGIIWSPAAGKRWHVLALFINVSAAAVVTLEDDKAGGDEAVMKMELAANSGIMIPFPEKYPFASGEDAADLLITTSAGNVYVTAVGYEI